MSQLGTFIGFGFWFIKRYVFDIARFIEVKAPHNISVEDLEDLVNEEALRMIESGDIRWTPIIEEEIN